MPPITKSRNSFFYTFLIVQLLLDVTFTNAAVIRKEKREIATNVTGIATSNNELDSTTVTTEEDGGVSLFGTGSNGDDMTTGKSWTDVTMTVGIDDKKEDTTLTGFAVDDNTVSIGESHSESKDEHANEEQDEEDDETVLNEKDSTAEPTIQANTTRRSEVSLTTGSVTALNEETSTTDRGTTQLIVQSETTTGSGPSLKEETFTTDGGTDQSTVETGETTVTGLHTGERRALENDSTSQAIVDSATTTKSVTTDETTSFNRSEEVTTVSTVKPVETTIALEGHTQNESTDVSTEQSFASDTSTVFVTNQQHDDMTDRADSSPVSENNSTTPSFLGDQSLTKSLMSTLKSDETTVILTSTETSDESPIQTTFYASPHLQDLLVEQEIKNSTPSSAEKRGKFIDDNYSSPNELRLPNTSDVWALASMKTAGKVKSSELQNSVETSDEKAVNNSMVTKSLLDWTRVMMSTNEMQAETTAKIIESTTTEVPGVQTTTEVTLTEISTTKFPIDATTEVVNLTDGTHESTILTENEVENKTSAKFETTTSLDDKQEASTSDRLTIDDTSLSQTEDDILLTTKSSLILLKGRHDGFIEDNKVEGSDSVEEKPPLLTTTTTTTTTTAVIPNIATMKSETTNSPVNGETTEEEHTGTISTSTLSLIDFTTPMPFLTSTAPTATTRETTTTTAVPAIAFNMDEPPNMASTHTPSQSSPAATTTTTTVEPESTTITSPPAVTVMAATTEAHTPAIISNDTMTQKNNNYNNYEVLNETTTKSADNSSIEASEASTHVAANWATSNPETTTAEVDRLDDFDVTTVPTFENNNAYEIATPQPSATIASVVTFGPTTTIPSIIASGNSTTSTEDLDHIDSIQKISDTAETSIESNVIDPLHVGVPSTTTTTTTTTTTPPTTTTTTTEESSQENMRMQSTVRGEVDSISSTPATTTTTTTIANYDDSTTSTLQSISTKKEDVYSIVPTIDSGGFHVPKPVVDDATTTMSGVLAAGAGGGGGQPMDSPDGQETDVNVIIAISVSVVGIVALILLVAFLYVMRKRQKQMSYGQRCRPVSLDAYSLDNVSVYNSVRRKGAALRASKRSYGNVAFDDPSLRHNVLGTHELAKYVEKKSSIWEEFKDVPQIIARADEVPAGCEEKNRYANVIPLPETRVILQQQNGDEKSEYINANYVRGPKDTTNYYIACQAPLETTVTDFWRMIWEQNSRVIIMATDLIENGIDKCAEYLPPSVTLDNHTVFGDFQVTLKNREVKEKYAISTLMLKNNAKDESREIIHYWYQWPEAGVPTDEAAIIAMLLEARSSLKQSTMESSDTKTEIIITEEKPTAKNEINGNVVSEKTKPPSKDPGPLTIHCSPGTGRTGTILACDIAMRCLEEPKRCVDIPQIVYSVRRGRASAVQTKEQYEFIYKITNMYATKISNLNNDN